MAQTAEAALLLEAVEVDVALRVEATGTLVALTGFYGNAHHHNLDVSKQTIRT